MKRVYFVCLIVVKTLEENVAMVEKAACESLLVTEAFFLFQSVLN